MKFEVYEDAAGEWRWRLKAANNQIIAVSGEGYTRIGDCTDAIGVVRLGAPHAQVVHVGITDE